MRKLYLLSALLLSGMTAHAQPWVNNHTGKVKLKDVKAGYETQNANSYNKGGEKGSTRTKQFNRWYWFQSFHTDEQGYLVSPAKTMHELQKLQLKQAGNAMAKSTANQSSWSFAGPDSSDGGYAGIGRINTMAFHPTDTNTYWVGSAGGGAWKTTDDGLNWTAVADHWPVLSISDIDLNPQNPNTIYMCTGDRDGQFQYSLGIIRSYDGGANWETTPLTWNFSDMRLVNALVINPLDTNSMTIATSTGISKSYDGGTTWTQVETGQFMEILANPVDTNVLYASSFIPAEIYRSADGGATWTQVTNINGMRIAMTTSPNNPEIVKAVVANWNRGLEGVYHSSDTGKTFVQIMSDNACTTNILANTPDGDECGGQGEYDLCIAMDPNDPDDVIIGGVNTWSSDDGGVTFDLLNQWADILPGITTVHADKHFIAYHPSREAIFECNDGGVYRTSDGVIWNDLTNGMGITQFYRNGVSNNASYVLGGAQDNGSKAVWPNGEAEDVGGGDGMECHIDPTDSNRIYVAVQNGVLIRIDTAETIISYNIPDTPTGAWITPYLIDPTDHNTLIAGYKSVYRSQDKGDSWTTLPGTFGSNLDRLAMTADNNQTIYAVESDTNLVYYTHDLGNTWNSITPPVTAKISDIKADPQDKDHIWVTFKGFGSAKVMEYTAGNGWTDISDSLPDVPVYCIEVDTANYTLYTGTELGVFYKDSTMTHWVMYNDSLPYIQVMDLGINYTTNEIWAATFGRGMWKSPRFDTAYTNSVKNVMAQKEMLVLSPNPNNGQFNIAVNGWLKQGEKVMVAVTDMAGRVVWKGNVTVNSNNLKMEMKDLAKGNYIVELEANKQRKKARLTVY